MAHRRHPARRTPTRSSCPRRSPGRRSMRYLAKAGFSQSYTYFTWRNTKAGAARVLHRADADRAARVHAAEPLRQHAGHPPRVPADRRTPRVRGAPRFSRRRSARATASTAASSCARTCRSSRAPRSTSTRRSTRSRPRDWTRTADSLAELIARVNDIRRAHAALQYDRGAARSTTTDNAQLLCYSKRAPDDAAIRSSSSSTSIPH